MVIAFGLTLIGWGLVVSQSSADANPLPAAIESVEPVTGAVQVLQQARVFVDLAPGHRGYLIVDGIELELVDIADEVPPQAAPGQQISLPPVAIYEPGNNTITFTPTEGAQIESLDSGRHQAQVVYWREADGPDRARSYTWTFDVI
jgi:hypothetical protein